MNPHSGGGQASSQRVVCRSQEVVACAVWDPRAQIFEGDSCGTQMSGGGGSGAPLVDKQHTGDGVVGLRIIASTAAIRVNVNVRCLGAVCSVLCGLVCYGSGVHVSGAGQSQYSRPIVLAHHRHCHDGAGALRPPDASAFRASQ